MNDACNPLLTQTAELLEAARSSDDIAEAVTADEIFELITALSWAADRFGDDRQSARRRVSIATAGIFS